MIQDSQDGVIPIQLLQQMIHKDYITATSPLTPSQLQPASLDLRLSHLAYRVRASFLLEEGISVKQRLADFSMHEINLSQGAVFEKGCVYIVPLQESLNLPHDIRAVANAKSSTGRLDILARLITDSGQEFDRVNAGYKGPLYLEIAPRTFSICVYEGSSLNQTRFKKGCALYSDSQLRDIHCQTPLVNKKTPHFDGGLSFSVDLSGHNEDPVGYRARSHAGLIDLDKVDYYDIHEFWEPVYLDRSGGIILEPAAFYILKSHEMVQIPAFCAAEMTPYLAVVGEFRVHYAGFFDPGFGIKEAEGEGARAVLEVRCHETPFALKDGQIMGRLCYEPMIEVPDQLYGKKIGSTYQAQGLKLSKYFRMHKNEQ